MVNCCTCGTTRVCDRLEYAYLRSKEAASLIDLSFFTPSESAAA